MDPKQNTHICDGPGCPSFFPFSDTLEDETHTAGLKVEDLSQGATVRVSDLIRDLLQNFEGMSKFLLSYQSRYATFCTPEEILSFFFLVHYLVVHYFPWESMTLGQLPELFDSQKKAIMTTLESSPLKDSLLQFGILKKYRDFNLCDFWDENILLDDGHHECCEHQLKYSKEVKEASTIAINKFKNKLFMEIRDLMGSDWDEAVIREQVNQALSHDRYYQLLCEDIDSVKQFLASENPYVADLSHDQEVDLEELEGRRKFCRTECGIEKKKRRLVDLVQKFQVSMEFIEQMCDDLKTVNGEFKTLDSVINAVLGTVLVFVLSQSDRKDLTVLIDLTLSHVVDLKALPSNFQVVDKVEEKK